MNTARLSITTDAQAFGIVGMTERQLQAQVEALARVRGWLVYHTHERAHGGNNKQESLTTIPDLGITQTSPRGGRSSPRRGHDDSACHP